MKLEEIALKIAETHYSSKPNAKIDETYRLERIEILKNQITEAFKKAEALQLQQTGVMACFSEEQLSQINKYGKHQHNRGAMELSYVSFEFWLK